MSKNEEIRHRIYGLQRLLNRMIDDGAAYQNIYFVSLLMNRLCNQLYCCAEKKTEQR